MTTLYMYDSTDVNQIPLTAKMAAGYHEGALIPTTLPALRKRLPSAYLVSICVHAGQRGDVADYERGDFLLGQLPQWALDERAAGLDPIIYCSTYDWPGVRHLFAAMRVELPWWWEAHYDNVPILSSDPRAVAKQYANATFTKRNLDISIVGPNWPGLPKPPEETDMQPAILVKSSDPTDTRLFVYTVPSGLRHLAPAEVGVLARPGFVANPGAPEPWAPADITSILTVSDEGVAP